MSATPPQPEPEVQWDNAASVASYLTTAAAVAVDAISLLHPGFKEPAVVQALVPSVATVIAGVVTAVEVVTKRAVAKVKMMGRR